MAKTHPPYPPEFRRQMVELVHAGRGPEELAREFEPSAQAIRNWVEQTGVVMTSVVTRWTARSGRCSKISRTRWPSSMG